ncbi:MAG: hypothetical protein EB126_11450 [Synechococcaceae bacterium WBB_10_009]|nr:hypothetical protein [Synechococcaceae bacterium WBB_10_009]
MAFYSPDPAMDQALVDLVHLLETSGRSGLGEHLSITWLRFAESQIDRATQLEPAAYWAGPVQGSSWRGDQLR